MKGNEYNSVTNTCRLASMIELSRGVCMIDPDDADKLAQAGKILWELWEKGHKQIQIDMEDEDE